ncbi:MAG TPA: chorismate-binding protein, partial [Candidatus Dormibacteraeota bacterium]|nr:chorismate-binding protein [Candidatus Dormibacteraeota bacterium]
MKFQTRLTDLNQDPLDVFERLVGEHDYCFLLETLADKYQPQTSGQSYIGIAPEKLYSTQGGKFYIDGLEQKTANPYDSLRGQISFDKNLPSGYIGGLVGYFSHEAIHHLEPSLEFPYERDFPDFEFARYNDGLVFRHGHPPEYFYQDQDRLALYKGKTPKIEELSITFGETAKNTGQYDQMIEKARDDIQNGRVFQVVLANRYEYRYSGDLLALYRELRRINPSPFMFFMKFGNVITLGASPELLVHTNPDDEVYLEALAGT